MSRTRLIALVLTASAFAAGIWAALIEPNLLVVTRIQAPLCGLAHPLRFLLVSDLHLHAADRAARLDRYSERLADLARDGLLPELILLAGDTVERDDEAQEIARDLVERTRPYLRPDQMVFILGNHEHEGTVAPGLKNALPALYPDQVFHPNNAAAIAAHFATAGMTVLVDQAIAVGGPGGIRLVGLAWRGGRGPTNAGLALLGSGTGAPAESTPTPEGTGPQTPTVIVAHSPDQLVGLPLGCATLGLAGHTHGGQVTLPFVGAVITATETRLPRAAGWMRLSGLEVFVSRGAGQGIPLRFNAVPELVLIDLVAANTER